MLQDEVASGKKTNWPELEITGEPVQSPHSTPYISYKLSTPRYDPQPVTGSVEAAASHCPVPERQFSIPTPALHLPPTEP